MAGLKCRGMGIRLGRGRECRRRARAGSRPTTPARTPRIPKPEERERAMERQARRDGEDRRPADEEAVDGVRGDGGDDGIDQRLGLEDHPRVEDLHAEDRHAERSAEHRGQAGRHRGQQQDPPLLAAQPQEPGDDRAQADGDLRGRPLAPGHSARADGQRRGHSLDERDARAARRRPSGDRSRRRRRSRAPPPPGARPEDEDPERSPPSVVASGDPPENRPGVDVGRGGEDAGARGDEAAEPLQQERLREIDRGVEEERCHRAEQTDQETVEDEPVGRGKESPGVRTPLKLPEREHAAQGATNPLNPRSALIPGAMLSAPVPPASTGPSYQPGGQIRREGFHFRRDRRQRFDRSRPAALFSGPRRPVLAIDCLVSQLAEGQ